MTIASEGIHGKEAEAVFVQLRLPRTLKLQGIFLLIILAFD